MGRKVLGYAEETERDGLADISQAATVAEANGTFRT